MGSESTTKRTEQQTILYHPNDDDLHLANRIVQARARTQPVKESGEIEGALSEVAFAQVFGLPLPEANYERLGDGGIDFTMPSGATVDVKSISGDDYWRLGLLVPKRLRAGIYVLVHVSFDTPVLCTILGWQTGGFAASRGQDKFDTWRIHQRDLLPSSRLYDHVTR